MYKYKFVQSQILLILNNTETKRNQACNLKIVHLTKSCLNFSCVVGIVLVYYFLVVSVAVNFYRKVCNFTISISSYTVFIITLSRNYFQLQSNYQKYKGYHFQTYLQHIFERHFPLPICTNCELFLHFIIRCDYSILERLINCS